MNLRDLDYLVAVADAGQFATAAERCGVSQPTLSMQIRKLEQELDLILFERGPRGAVATAIGRQVVAQARATLREAKRIREIAREHKGGVSEALRLGIIPTAGPYLLPLAVPALKRDFPHLRFQLREAITSRLLDLVRAMGLDAAVLSTPFDSEGLEWESLGIEHFLVALPLDHPFAAEAELAPERLAGETVLMLEEGHCFRDQTMRLTRRLDLVAAHEVEANSIESLRQMVSVGMGCAILPALAATGPFAQGAPVVLRPIRHPDAARELVLVWRRAYPRRDQLRTIARTLASLLREP